MLQTLGTQKTTTQKSLFESFFEGLIFLKSNSVDAILENRKTTNALENTIYALIFGLMRDRLESAINIDVNRRIASFANRQETVLHHLFQFAQRLIFTETSQLYQWMVYIRNIFGRETFALQQTLRDHVLAVNRSMANTIRYAKTFSFHTESCIDLKEATDHSQIQKDSKWVIPYHKYMIKEYFDVVALHIVNVAELVQSGNLSKEEIRATVQDQAHQHICVLHHFRELQQVELTRMREFLKYLLQ